VHRDRHHLALGHAASHARKAEYLETERAKAQRAFEQIVDNTLLLRDLLQESLSAKLQRPVTIVGEINKLSNSK
jgi:hypothetical protein